MGSWIEENYFVDLGHENNQGVEPADYPGAVSETEEPRGEKSENKEAENKDLETNKEDKNEDQNWTKRLAQEAVRTTKNDSTRSDSMWWNHTSM